MADYRCYFMSGEAIQAVRIYACANENEVILKLKGILLAHPEYPAAEIWDGSSFVAKLTRDALKVRGSLVQRFR